jgi:hypothetical protein
MKNMPFSCVFCAEILGFLPITLPLSFYLPVPLRSAALRKDKNIVHPGLKLLNRGRTLDEIWDLELSTATIDENLSFQPLAEQTSAAVLPQQLLELGLTRLGTRATVNSGLRCGF